MCDAQGALVAVLRRRLPLLKHMAYNPQALVELAEKEARQRRNHDRVVEAYEFRDEVLAFPGSAPHFSGARHAAQRGGSSLPTNGAPSLPSTHPRAMLLAQSRSTVLNEGHPYAPTSVTRSTFDARSSAQAPEYRRYNSDQPRTLFATKQESMANAASISRARRLAQETNEPVEHFMGGPASTVLPAKAPSVRPKALTSFDPSSFGTGPDNAKAPRHGLRSEGVGEHLLSGDRRDELASLGRDVFAVVSKHPRPGDSLPALPHAAGQPVPARLDRLEQTQARLASDRREAEVQAAVVESALGGR